MSRSLLAFAARRAVWLMSIVLIAPLVAGLLSGIGTKWFPTGDMAQAELHVRGFLAHPPLVGAAGRIESDAVPAVQGSHPGPGLWLALYPVYALLGRTSRGLTISAVAVHAVTLALIAALARRRGGMTFAGCLTLTLLLVIRSSGPAAFIEPWNPWFATLPFVLFLLTLWSSLASSPRWLIAAVALGSYCIHCHAGYVLVVGLPLLATAAMSLRRSPPGERPGRVVAWCFGAAAIMWVLPIVDELRRSPGNLTILWQHFGSPSEPTIAVRTAAKVLLSELSIAGPWATGPALVERNAVGAAVTIALWLWTWRWARRRRDESMLMLHRVLLSVVVAGAVSIVRIFGPYQEYTIRWFWLVTAMIVATSLAEAVQQLHLRRHRWRSIASRSIGVALVVVAVASAVQFVERVEVTDQIDSRQVAQIIDATRDALPETGRFLVRWHDPVGLGAVPFGLVLELEREGLTTGVDEQFSAAALPHRVMAERSADGVLWVVLGGRIERFEAAGYKPISTGDLRSAAEQQRSAELRSFLDRRFAELGAPDEAKRIDEQYGAVALMFHQPPFPTDVADAVRELVGLRMPVAVFLLKPGDPAPT